MRNQFNRQENVREKISSVSVIRYADDFVVLHKDYKVINLCKQKIEEWLIDIGLELKPSKTRISHTLNTYLDEKPGFDFLGFNVIQVPVGNYNSGKDSKGNLLGFKTLITPSKESQKRHYHKVSEVINKSLGASQGTLINILNPIIRGWCNYFSTVVSKKVFRKLAHLTFFKLWKWGRHRHQNKGRSWVRLKYFKTIDNNR